MFSFPLPFQTSSPNSSNENSPVSPPDEPSQGEAPPQLEEEEPAFPHTDLAKLDDMINRCVRRKTQTRPREALPPSGPDVQLAYLANWLLLAQLQCKPSHPLQNKCFFSSNDWLSGPPPPQRGHQAKDVTAPRATVLIYLLIVLQASLGCSSSAKGRTRSPLGSCDRPE